MRILFDSKQEIFKTPFGVLAPGEKCTLHVHIPTAVQTRAAQIVLCGQDGQEMGVSPMQYEQTLGPYEYWRGEFSFSERGLYFYYFRITDPNGTFRLFKEGDDANMEAGDLWQVSCIPADFYTPEWAKGGVIYQVFPDRFCKRGDPDLWGKLQPYTIHQNWDEEVDWRPDDSGPGAEQRLFRRQFPGHYRENGLYCLPGHHHSLPEPHQQKLLLPPLRHWRLQDPGPHAGHGGGLSGPLPGGPQPGDAGHAGRGRSTTPAPSAATLTGDGPIRGNGALLPDRQSPYSSWYHFHHWPDSIRLLVGHLLPARREQDATMAILDYIIRDEDSVVRPLAPGWGPTAGGWTWPTSCPTPLSIALPTAADPAEPSPTRVVIGEVWEDGSNKVAYDVRRQHFLGGQLRRA